MAKNPSNNALPPTIDGVAAKRWLTMPVKTDAPWLHEEVGKRMVERLPWIKKTPSSWLHWNPAQGGLATHRRVADLYQKSPCFLAFEHMDNAQAAIKKIAYPWWNQRHWTLPAAQALACDAMPPSPVQMLWANMCLHTQADPQSLLMQWYRALAVDGFLMFSCLGPDTVKEMRGLYEKLGLGACGHSFTDMHDWGDMLVQAGFAEPVMDMERIVLSFATPERALQELRGLGRNLHPQRFAALRGKKYLENLQSAMDQHLRGADGQIQLTFEVVYGHAFKPTPRIKVSAQSAVSIQDMRAMLAQGKAVG